MTNPILLVDDSRADARLVREALRELERDERLEVATDGEAGLARLRGDEEFQLVLLDISMPRLSGVQVLERLGEQASARNVVVLTTSSSTREHARCLELGARAVHVKPADFDELCRLLDGVLP